MAHEKLLSRVDIALYNLCPDGYSDVKDIIRTKRELRIYSRGFVNGIDTARRIIEMENNPDRSRE